MAVEMADPECEEKVAKFRKAYQHEIALNKSRDLNQREQIVDLRSVRADAA